ncbi:MAG: DUF6754 domain-containing protein [Kofleriaceae bacterium]
MRRVVVAALVVLGLGASARADQLGAPPPDAGALAAPRVRWLLQVASPANDDGTRLAVRWTGEVPSGSPPSDHVIVLRRPARAGDGAGAERIISPTQRPTLPPEFLYADPGGGPDRFEVDTNAQALEVGKQVGDWTVVAIAPPRVDGGGEVIDVVGADARVVYVLQPAVAAATPGTFGAFIGGAVQSPPVAPSAAWFNTDRWFLLALIAAVGLAFGAYIVIAKRRRGDLFVRRIAGVDAIEDAIGRSTEMGRPVLYVTGVDEPQDIQTIASLMILGHVAEMAATYDTQIKVANAYPMTMVVAEEIVRQGFANAGRPDAHRPDDVMFITSEQFAFAAAVNGMILRDRPAANIYLGRFYAESLILAETGFLTGAVQIAGTAEFTQLPFFIAACDHTLIGEELYATSAYLSHDPVQLAQLKAGDVMKVVIFVLVMAGVIAGTFWHVDVIGTLLP